MKLLDPWLTLPSSLVRFKTLRNQFCPPCSSAAARSSEHPIRPASSQLSLQPHDACQQQGEPLRPRGGQSL